jgi:rubrerythrin
MPSTIDNENLGTIFLKIENITEEQFEKVKEQLRKVPCNYDIVLTDSSQVVHLEESFFGPCQWCGEFVYTKSVCPECGKVVDLS